MASALALALASGPMTLALALASKVQALASALRAALTLFWASPKERREAARRFVSVSSQLQ